MRIKNLKDFFAFMGACLIVITLCLGAAALFGWFPPDHGHTDYADSRFIDTAPASGPFDAEYSGQEHLWKVILRYGDGKDAVWQTLSVPYLERQGISPKDGSKIYGAYTVAPRERFGFTPGDIILVDPEMAYLAHIQVDYPQPGRINTQVSGAQP